MAFKFCDSMIHDYWQQGYVCFRNILPASLVRDLRVECDKARRLAHEINGPQAQRLQPVTKYGDRLNLKPFYDYSELPVLVDAVNRLLGPFTGPVKPATMSVLGVLVEPLERPRQHGWHRDGVSDHVLPDQKKADLQKAWGERVLRPYGGNQINCAIYPDSCLWYVPGSHLRYHDLPGERQLFDYNTPGGNPFDSMQGSEAELERIYIEECQRFPGAQCMHLYPGDYLLYRSNAWHTGLYFTYQPRATLHDSLGYGN